jgi:hypothetical protein
MLTSPLGAEDITTQSGSYAPHLVSSYAHAYAATANQNPVVEPSQGYRFSYCLRNIRVVHRLATIATEVLTIMPQLREETCNSPFKLQTTMVTAQSNVHFFLPI